MPENPAPKKMRCSLTENNTEVLLYYNFLVLHEPVFESQKPVIYTSYTYTQNTVLYCATATQEGVYQYTYALNNPLVYTDPDGEFLWIPFIIGAAIGGYLGGISANEGELNPLSWKNDAETWLGVGAGAAIGGFGAEGLWAGTMELATGYSGAGGSALLTGYKSDWSFQWTTDAGGGGNINMNKPVSGGDIVAGSNEYVNYYMGGYTDNSPVYDPLVSNYLDRNLNLSNSILLPEVTVRWNGTPGSGEFVDLPSWYGQTDIVTNPYSMAVYRGHEEFLEHPLTQATMATLPIGESALVFSRAAGPIRNWIRFGKSYHQGAAYQSLRWGAGREKYFNEIANPTLRSWNRKLRGFFGGHLDLWKVR